MSPVSLISPSQPEASLVSPQFTTSGLSAKQNHYCFCTNIPTVQRPLTQSTMGLLKLIKHRAGVFSRKSDGASVCSTETVERPTKVQVLEEDEEATTLVMVPKKVRFAPPTENRSYECSWSRDECDEYQIWYNQSDYYDYKVERVEYAREFKKIGTVSSMETLYQACLDLENETSQPLPAREEKVLREAWNANAEFIGLEVYASTLINNGKFERRKRISDAVLKLQFFSDTFSNPNDLAETIRRSSEKLSLPGRKFALQVANFCESS